MMLACNLLCHYRMKQLLIPQHRYSKRKEARAISLRGANHITLKANAFVLRKHHRVIKQIIHATQLRYSIKLQAVAIMSNHIHLLTKVPSRKAFANALRFLTSRIALRLGRGTLWNIRAWSRPVKSRTDIQNVTNYIWLNPSKANTVNGRIDSYCIQNEVLIDMPIYEALNCDIQTGFGFL